MRGGFSKAKCTVRQNTPVTVLLKLPFLYVMISHFLTTMYTRAATEPQ